MATISQLQNKLRWAKKQTSYAWAKYYEQCNQTHETLVSEHATLTTIQDSNTSLPQHIINEIEDKMKKLKEQIECPVCLDIIPCGELDITRCGHKYCKECCEKLKQTTHKCAVCRKPI